MVICAAGDIHGAIGRFYTDLLAFEAALGTRFAWVLHGGRSPLHRAQRRRAARRPRCSRARRARTGMVGAREVARPYAVVRVEGARSHEHRDRMVVR
jgi:hypothetical protein